jgi:hypothetical protein
MHKPTSFFLAPLGLLFLAGCGGSPAPVSAAIRAFPLLTPNSGSQSITTSGSRRKYGVIDSQ